MNIDTNKEQFSRRHISAGKEQISDMLEETNAHSLDELTDEIIPENIRLQQPMDLNEPLGEYHF